MNIHHVETDIHGMFGARMVERRRHVQRVRRLLRDFPVVAILGTRQVGKTTLAGQVGRGTRGPVHVFDLEDPRDRARLADPMLALEPLRGLVVLDEVQRQPDLFAPLRVLADRPGAPARFLALGSASMELLRQTAETLAGRVVFHELQGFSLQEVGAENVERRWLRGGFPRSYLAADEARSLEWRRAFVQTFVERDLPQLGVGIPSETLRRFWTMLANAHGQVWNAAEFARSFGVSESSVRRYLDTLVSAFAVRRLRPWSENLDKRQVKSPKVYVADSGILHALLGLGDLRDLEVHPRLGASFEGFGLETVADLAGARPEECFFWGTYQGAELDLLVVRGRRRVGFEFKRTASPSVTPSMRIALRDLRLDRLDVVHAGAETYPLADRVRAVALRRAVLDVRPLDAP
jgi:predicted AAA+ superfamily ATPase